jgi:hypothetical protein
MGLDFGLRIIGLQVRTMPGANQVPKPICRRFKASKIRPKKTLLAKVLPLFGSTPLVEPMPNLENTVQVAAQRVGESYLDTYEFAPAAC